MLDFTEAVQQLVCAILCNVANGANRAGGTEQRVTASTIHLNVICGNKMNVKNEPTLLKLYKRIVLSLNLIADQPLFPLDK